MSHPWHHAMSSAKKWGGEPEDYYEVHSWFDLPSKSHMADFRHRSLRHHSFGIAECEEHFGATIELSICKRCGTGALSMLHDPEEEVIGRHEFEPKVIPTRWIGEQHVQEDLGRIPTLAEWLSCIEPAPWMNRARRLSKELDEFDPRILEQEEADAAGDGTPA